MSYKYADELARRRAEDLAVARWRWLVRPLVLLVIAAAFWVAFNSCVPVAATN